MSESLVEPDYLEAAGPSDGGQEAIEIDSSSAARLETAPAVARDSGAISPQSSRHHEMRREALRNHPEIRELFGSDPRPALAIPVLLALHWGTAWLLRDSGLFVIFLVSFFWGQLLVHSAGALLHDAAHRAVFRGKRTKVAFDIGLEMIMGTYGRLLTYQHEHMSSHHPHIGDYERDYEHEDTCRYLARRSFHRKHPRFRRLTTIVEILINLLPFGFLIAGEVIPRFYKAVTGRETKDPQRDIAATKADPWMMSLFIGVTLTVNAGLFFAFGWKALLYHIWSLSHFIGKCGVTNLGQSLSEHPDGDVVDPTCSTYGPINWILFNTGYHNEHHTFPNVPCFRLPKLKAIAPEVFHATSHKSYARLWWEHVCKDFSPTRQNEFLYRDNAERCGGPPLGADEQPPYDPRPVGATTLF
ncbi:MAG: fatty acid desaturase [Myxococcota bacterium]|nr:fatty acid desaturase [Myxococcota bacterium]